MSEKKTCRPDLDIDAIQAVKPFVPAKKTWPAKLVAKTMSIYHKFILGSKRWRVVTRNGIKYRLQCDFIGKQIIKHGAFQQEKNDFFIECARQLDTEIHIDCGAHVGTHLLPVMAAGLAKEYYAIEAGSIAFNALQKNVELNGLADQVRLFNNALSDCEKEVVFCYHSTIAQGGQGIENDINAHSLSNATKVLQAVPLDSLVKLQNRRISLKIDVEGHELAVFKGAQKLLAGNQILLQVEIWDHHAAHLNWLFANGFYLIAAIEDDYYLRNFDLAQL